MQQQNKIEQQVMKERVDKVTKDWIALLFKVCDKDKEEVQNYVLQVEVIINDLLKK